MLACSARLASVHRTSTCSTLYAANRSAIVRPRSRRRASLGLIGSTPLASWTRSVRACARAVSRPMCGVAREALSGLWMPIVYTRRLPRESVYRSLHRAAPRPPEMRRTRPSTPPAMNSPGPSRRILASVRGRRSICAGTPTAPRDVRRVAMATTLLHPLCESTCKSQDTSRTPTRSKRINLGQFAARAPGSTRSRIPSQSAPQRRYAPFQQH